MVRIALVGKDIPGLEKLLAPYHASHTVVTQNPEFVVAFGGDGTLMQAEYEFPGVPKLFLRNSRIAKLAHTDPNEHVLRAFFKKECIVEEHLKLEASVRDARVTALNDIVIHNENPRSAVRYQVRINGTVRHDEVIGDGIVCATPLGSTGYYRSITDSVLETGIGLAFNNSTEQTDHLVLREDACIEIKITRGPAFCYADNQEEHLRLVAGDTVTIARAPDTAKIVRIKK